MACFFSGFEFVRNFISPSECKALSRKHTLCTATHARAKKSSASRTKRLRWVFALLVLAFIGQAQAASSSYLLWLPWSKFYDSLPSAVSAGESYYRADHPSPPPIHLLVLVARTSTIRWSITEVLRGYYKTTGTTRLSIHRILGRYGLSQSWKPSARTIMYGTMFTTYAWLPSNRLALQMAV